MSLRPSPLALSLLLSATLVGAVGCSKKESGPPPAKPANGAPIAFEVTKVTPGDRGALEVKAYNFADKPVAGYSILLRYADKAGARIRLKVGTPFEKDNDHWSMQGPDMKCEPQSWCSFEIDHLEIPDNAVKADVVAVSVRAIAPDGQKFEPDDLWAAKDRMKWPAEIP